MFGKNTIEKLDHGDGETLRVVSGSPFLTIQGEGPYSGQSAVFIRLHGCHLRCIFCDTNFDNPDDPVWAVGDLVRKAMTIRKHARLAVITGGEPMRQNIVPLCCALNACGFKVQIETAGTYWLDGIETVADIVCSPKTPTIHSMIYEHAVAFKYIISGGMDFSQGWLPVTATQPGARPAPLAPPREGAPVYLSPCDEYDDARTEFNQQLVGELAIAHGLIAGVQLHKLLRVP
jgi:organic radical activating enzyme